jgi:hypothetical protein
MIAVNQARAFHAARATLFGCDDADLILPAHAVVQPTGGTWTSGVFVGNERSVGS